MQYRSTFCILIPALLASATLLAQPDIEEIIVTSDYRQQTIDAIAASISVIDTDTMVRKNAQHLEDVLINAPNVNFSSGASRARFIQIRGIGERGQFSEPLNSSVGMMIDGVDFSGIGNAAMLYDIEQVEIFKGPQGTRYGSNALAGLINLQSKAPTAEQHAGYQLLGANNDEYGVAGYISGPATDDLFYRLSFQQLESDGASQNLFLGRPTNTRDETTLRAKFRWLINETDQLDFTTSLIDLDNGYDAFSLDNVRDTLSDEPGFDRQDSKLASLKYASSRFDAFSFEVLGGFAQSAMDYGYDEDWVYTGFHPWEYSSTDKYFRDRETTSGELRFVSSEDGRLFGDRTDWVAGIYSLHQTVSLDRAYTFLPDTFSSHFTINRLAIYAETNTTLSDHWTVDLGARSEHYSAGYLDTNALRFDPSDDMVGGKFNLNYHLDDDNLLYAGISRGYKSGGFNTDGSLDADLREYTTETLWNLEAGFKGQLANNISMQLSVFTMERNDVQISSSTVRVRDDGSAEFIDYIGNAAGGRNKGLELNSQWQLRNNVALYGSLGWLEAKYQDFINANGDNLDGREQAHAPSYQFTLGGAITFSNVLTLDINLQGRDSFYFSDSHDVRSDSYVLLNASLEYQKGRIHTILWGRNLTDEDYFVRGFYFGNDPRDGYTAKGYTQLGESARYGLTVNVDF